MINIDVRDRNLLVTLSAPAKSPIKARSGSGYFYNSMELVCVALGACFGGQLVKLCTHYKVNPASFESLQITMENFVPTIIIQHPKDISEEFRKEIEYEATHCPVSKMLMRTPEVKFIENTVPVEILIDETKRSTCCGG